MKKIYFALFGLLAYAQINAQCTPRALPYAEGFATNPLQTCTPTLGGWVGTTVASQAGWWIPSPATNYAGGAIPEIEAYGNQANGGISETITLTSPPINTSGITSYTLSFKQNLYTTNGGAGGSSMISIKVEASNNMTNWTQLYANSYSATPSLNSVLLETRTIPVSSGFTDTTYFRFSISGVLFKVWGWEIDNVSVQGTSGSTGMQSVYGNESAALPNPFQNTLNLNLHPGTTRVVICDLLGKTVFEQITNEEHLQIDTKKLNAGLYVLKLEDEAGIRTSKLLKN